MNKAYTINRKTLLKVLGFTQDKLPIGVFREWYNVQVNSGRYGDGPIITLPYIYLAPSGVANRLRVSCPKCESEMRFCALQQHVGTKTCQTKAKKSKAFDKMFLGHPLVG